MHPGDRNAVSVTVVPWTGQVNGVILPSQQELDVFSENVNQDNQFDNSYIEGVNIILNM